MKQLMVALLLFSSSLSAANYVFIYKRCGVVFAVHGWINGPLSAEPKTLYTATPIKDWTTTSKSRLDFVNSECKKKSPNIKCYVRKIPALGPCPVGI